MTNMSYCRFRNTLEDLLDCEENLHNELGKEEHHARKKLVEACQRIVDEAGKDGANLTTIFEEE